MPEAILSPESLVRSHLATVGSELKGTVVTKCPDTVKIFTALPKARWSKVMGRLACLSDRQGLGKTRTELKSELTRVIVLDTAFDKLLGSALSTACTVTR